MRTVLRPSLADRQAALERGPSSDLGGHSARGVVWTVSGQWGAQLLRLGSTIVLARLLTPDDFGLVAEVAAITGLISVAGSLGLSEAVVQRTKITHEQASALFWTNALLGVVLAVLLAAASPLLSLFYGRHELVWITVAMSSTFILTGLTVQHQALMLRRLQFKSVATRTLLATGVGLAISVALALAGFGYWSLVLGQIATAAVAAAVTWAAVAWRPSRPRRAEGLRELLSFGSGISTFRILDYASKNADNVIIGRVLGAVPLGLYTRGYGLLMLPLTQIHGPVANVVRPTMAALWPEPQRYRRYYLSTLSGLCFFVMPLVAVLAVLAGPLVAVMLGPQWSSSVDVFRWLAIAGFLQVVGFTNGWLYTSSGRAWAMARWGLFSRPLLICSFFIGVQFGIVGVAIAYAVSQVILTPLGIARAGRGTPVSLPDVLKVTIRPAVVAAAAGVTALATLLALRGQAPAVQLVAGLVLAVGVSAVVLLRWRSARVELTSLLSSLRATQSPKSKAATTQVPTTQADAMPDPPTS